MPNNKLLLNIAGLSILVNTAEDETYTRDLAQELDADITAILEGNPAASVTNAALLCALDYLDGSKKSTRTANHMRSQIKEYLADAAKAKLQYDEEHKRASDLAVEIQALRSHLTRLATEGDSSGVVENIKSELAASRKELEDVREKAGRIAAAHKALTEKSDAMSEYIAGQDRELESLRAEVKQLRDAAAPKDEMLAAQSARIDTLTADNTAAKQEIERLNGEVAAYYELLDEAAAVQSGKGAKPVVDAVIPAPVSADPIDNPPPQLFDYEAELGFQSQSDTADESDFAGASGFAEGLQPFPPADGEPPIIEALDEQPPHDPNVPDLSWTLDIP